MPPITSTPALPAETGGHHQRPEQWQGQEEKENAEAPSLRGKQVRVRACVGRGEYVRDGVSPLATRDGIGKVTDTLARVVASQPQLGRLRKTRRGIESEKGPVPSLSHAGGIESLSRKCNERYRQRVAFFVLRRAGARGRRVDLSRCLSGQQRAWNVAPLIPCD